ncbi:hypothetical protein GN956_G21008 [Arapaima gigas]
MCGNCERPNTGSPRIKSDRRVAESECVVRCVSYVNVDVSNFVALQGNQSVADATVGSPRMCLCSAVHANISRAEAGGGEAEMRSVAALLLLGVATNLQHQQHSVRPWSQHDQTSPNFFLHILWGKACVKQAGRVHQSQPAAQHGAVLLLAAPVAAQQKVHLQSAENLQKKPNQDHTGSY